MASSSVYIASDQVYDFNCSKCDEDGKDIAAQHFCPECEHYLCDKCVRLHNGFHRQHTVYGQGEIQKWAGFAMDRCDQHSNKLEVHCDDHQELCCFVCVALKHKRCSNISHLPDLASGFLKKDEFKQLPAEVYKMRSRLDEIRNARMKDQATLKDSYKDILAEIKALRKEMNNMFDQLEKETVEQVDSMMKDLETSVKDEIEACAQMHDQLKNMVERVQRMSGKHQEINSYIGYKKCQVQLTKGQSLTHDIDARPKERVLFYPNNKIVSFLKGFDTLGNIICTNVYNCFSVNIRSEGFHGYIAGICVMPNGDFVIAQHFNTRVKLLNSQYQNIAHCDLPGHAYDLCHTIGNEVCVAVFIEGYFTNRSELHFLKVTGGNLHKMKIFPIDHHCISIAHHQGRLYVIYGSALYQYTMYGELVKKIYENQKICKCAVSPDGERIYVTLDSSSSSLVTLDKSGQVLSSFEDQELCRPRGICVGPRGNVFVCGQNSHNVLQVDRDGKQKLATLARKADGLDWPQSVCFSEQTSSLIVGAFKRIYVLKIR